MEKVCTRCELVLPLTDFSKRKDIKSGFSPQCKRCKKKTRASRAGNQVCARYNKLYYEDNKESLNQKYWTNPKTREYQLNRYKEDPEKFRKQHEEYRKSNLDKFAAKQAKRRSSKVNATPEWLTSSQIKKMEDFYWLAKDLEVVSGQQYHVDHIVPLRGKSVCGLHVPWNLQILPSDINLSKSNRYEE